MHKILVLVGLGVCLSVPATAQEKWTEYRNVQDGFHALFPGQPTVTETTWESQAGFILPERVYAVERGGEHYSVRVIDYTGVEQMGLERAKECPAGAETCLGGANISGVGYWKHDVRGAPVYALWSFLKRGAQITDMFWNQLDLVSGVMVQMVNSDQTRSFVYVAMHEMRLYVSEGRVPNGRPYPGIFTQSVGWLDKEGRSVRYRNMYNHEIHGLREAPVPGYNADGRPVGGGGNGGVQGGTPPAGNNQQR